MNDCLKNIIKFKGSCEPNYNGKFVDDFVQVNPIILSNLANENELTGLKYGNQIIDSALENVATDILTSSGDIVLNNTIEALNYDGAFTNENFANGGILIRKATPSLLTKIVIKSLRIKKTQDLTPINLSIDDGKSVKDFVFDEPENPENLMPDSTFIQKLDLDYSTNENQVKIYITNYHESNTFYKINVNKKTCGSCSGKKYNLTAQPLFNQLPSNVDSTMIPEAYLTCDAENLICFALNNQVIKNLFLKAVAIQSGILIYDRLLLSNRLNDTTLNINADAVKDYHAELNAKYHELVFGLNFATGVKKSNIVPLTEMVKNNLKSTRDLCISCNSTFQVATALF